jgi:hypothetical protein
MHQKCSKAWDMQFHWLCDHIAQEQLHIFWDKGTHNLADYFTKHHPPIHHIKTRPTYILKNHMTQSFYSSVHNMLARV